MSINYPIHHHTRIKLHKTNYVKSCSFDGMSTQNEMTFQ
jgi:hypothetical protein